jgi:hypothetical protein
MFIGPGSVIKSGVTVAKPLPPVSYSLTSDTNNVNEGSSITIYVTTTAVPNGTTLWWTTGFGGTNMSGERLSATTGSVTVTGGAASFSITVSADNLTSPDQQYFRVVLYKNGPGGDPGSVEVDHIVINVNDTSTTPPIHGSAIINRAEGDYLSVAASSQFNLGTTWTIEFWLYINTPSANIGGSGIQGLLNQGGWYYGLPNNSMLVGLAAGQLTVCQGTSTTAITWAEPTPQQWVHVAIVNDSGTQKAFYNGIEQIKVGDNGLNGNYTNSELPLYIGSLAPAYGSPLDGKLTNLRITNTVVYTTNFYPPTTLPTKIAGTKLLWTPTDQALATDTSDSALTMTNSGVTYSSSYPAANSTHGSAVFDGSTNRYYRVSAGITALTTADSGNSGGLPNPPSPDGTGTYTRVNLVKYPSIVPGMTFIYDGITFTVAQVVPQENHFYDDLGLVTFYPRYNGTIPSGTTLTFYATRPWNLGTTWTIEWWQKSAAATAGNGNLYAVMGQAPDGGRIDIYYQSGNLVVQNGQTLCAEPPVGVWVHVAIVNNAGVGTVYYNGVAQSATGNFGNYGQTQDLYIGKRGNNPFQFFNGKLTNIRILDSAFYGSNFVPDQLPAVVAGHTKLLLRPTVDTIYGVDEGNLGLAVSSSGATYSTDYPPS